MSGRWLPALILELFIIGYALAKNGGNCNVDITNVPNFWITFTITTNDNIINAEVFNVTYKDELAFTDITYQSGTDLTKYFTASTNNGYLFLSTTPEMANFDQNTPKQTGDISGSFKVNLKCKDGASDFTVTAIVSDYNNHDPQFDQQEYVYNVASPLMPQIDFSVYGSVIKVTDLDFTNQDVTFTLDNEDFTITTIVDAADNKSYIPVFSAKSVIFLSDTRTYTLTAKDSGTNPGPRTSTATIKLVYDESVSLDAPSFGQPAYNFNYTIENDAAVLTPLDGPITLNTAKGDEVVLSIVGDLKDSLNVTITKDSNEITIKVKKPFDDKSLLMVATLEAKTDNAAIASLIFHMPKRSLEFGSHLYTGIYDVTDSTVTLNTAITINAEGLTATPTITVSGDLQEHFEITCKIDTGICDLSVKDLSYNDLQDYLPLELLLTIEVEDKTDTATLIITGNLDKLEFTKPVYQATYNPDDNTVTLEEEIGFNNNNDNINIQTGGSYGTSFELTYSSADKKWNVIVKTPLSQDILESETAIESTLTATDQYKNEAYSTLTVALPKGPRFTKSYFKAKYEKIDDQIINFEDELSFADVDNSIVNIVLDSYEDSFKIEYIDNVWKISVIKPPNDTILQNFSELFITMTAEIKTKTSVGSSVLILELPSNVQPSFKDVLYTTEYPKSGSGIMDFQPALTINDVKDPSTLSLKLSGFQDYFSIVYDNKKWQMQIIKPLDTSILSSHKELSASIYIGEDTTIATVLVISLPEIKPPEFSEHHYAGQYINSEPNAEVTLHDVISLTSYDDKVDVKLDNYTTYFDINFNNITKECNVTVKNPLDTNILNSNVYIVIGISAQDSFGTTIASLVLDLPTEEAPKFTQLHYSLTYQKDSQEITYDNPIQISNIEDSTKADIAIEKPYQSNFNVTYNKDTSAWELNVASLPKENPAAVTLSAKDKINKKTGETTVIFNVPEQIDVPPVFSEAHYFATYAISNNKGDITEADPIQISNKDINNIKLSLDKYASNFDFDLDEANKQWNLKLTQDLPDDVLQQNTELILTITASEIDNVENTAQSTLVIYLPSITNENYLNFTSVYYSSEYKTGADQLDVEIQILSNKDLSDAVLIVASDDVDFNTYFSFTNKSGDYGITVNEPIPDDILQQKNNLVYTLTATLEDLTSESVLIINFPKNTNESIHFSDVLYTGSYKVTNGKIDLTTDKIEVVNPDATDIVVSLTGDSSYINKFHATYSNNEVKVTVDSDFTSPAVDTIVLVLNIEVDGTKINSAVLNIAVEGSTDNIKFEKNLYNGKYTVESKEFLFEDTININTNKADDEITASILEANGEVSKNFNGSYAKNVFKIELTQPLDDTIVKNSNFLTIIPTVTVTGTSLTASTIVNIDIVKTEPGTGSIEFSNSLYNGNYTVTGDSTGEIVYDEISITTDQTDVNVSITNDYSQYFTSNYKNDKVSIETKGISSDVLVDITFIPLQLEAHSRTNPNIKATAILNLNIIGSTDYIGFEKNLYNGKYTVESKEFLFEDTININTNMADGEVTASILEENGEVSKNFKGSYAKNVFKIELTQPLDDTVVKNSNFLTIIPTVTVTGTSLSASTIVNIDIVKNEPETGHIEFSSTLYNGNYKVIDQGTGTVECENISLTTDQTDIEVTITNGYAEYFKVTYADNIVTLTTTVVPPNILANKTYIPLLLEAHSKANQNIKSSTVVTLNIIDNQQVDYSIAFEKPQYTGHYVIDLLGPGEFTIDGDINILTNYYDAHMYSSITDDNGNNFAKYFFSEMSNNKYTVGITDKYLSEDIYNNNDVISLILQAGIASENLVARTILNIQISRNYGSLKFSELLYEGSYTVSDDNTAVVSHGDIPLITPYTYDNMQIGIAADTQFFDYFNASVSGKNLVTIQSTKFIESYADFGSIPVNIQAEIPVHGTVLSANSILNLKVIDSSKNKSVLQFNEILYNAEYIVKDRKLNVDDKITIMSDADEKDIKSYFTAAENFKTFLTNFEAKYSNHAVTVNKLKDIDEKLLINIPYISLTLVLEVESTKTTANAVFNIKIAESAMKFNETLYKAEYVVKDSKFYIGKLALNSEIVYDNIDTAITSSSGFDKYFNCSYSKNEILIGLSEPIPASELKNVSYIPLTLKATVPDIGKEDSTIVTIKVIEPSDVNPDDGSGSNSDNTGYIIAVVILSLLIIALIAAGIAYYYFKLRNRDYTDVDADFWKVRFAKNAEKKKKKEKYGDSNIENRRPTGFVFNPLEEEHEEETSTDPTERRKSVLFDENVEKINIEPTIDEDVVEKQNGTTQST